MRFFLGFLTAILLAVVAGVAFVYSGVFNVAATVPHTAPEEWVLQTAKERSIRVRAGDIEAPDLADEDASARVTLQAFRMIPRRARSSP